MKEEREIYLTMKINVSTDSNLTNEEIIEDLYYVFESFNKKNRSE